MLLGADLTGHPSPQVRLAMAQALGGGVPDPEVRTGAITHLLRLSVDPAPEVRTRQVLEAPDARGVTLLHLQAAVELAGPGLLAVLNELSQEWTGDDDEHTARLARALTRSTPHAADRAAELEQQLAHGVNECLAGPDQGIYLTGSYPRTTLHFRNEPPQTGWWRRLWESEDPNTLDLPAEIATWSNGAGVNSDGDDAAPLTAQRDR